MTRKLSDKQVELIKMENGKKDLPVGISRNSGFNGWRLHRRVLGRKYHLGSFQNLEHAIRVNKQINNMVSDFQDYVERTSGDVVPIEEYEALESKFDSIFSKQEQHIEELNVALFVLRQERDQLKQRTLWQRILNK